MKTIFSVTIIIILGSFGASAGMKYSDLHYFEINQQTATPPDSTCKKISVKYDSKTHDTTYTAAEIAGLTFIKVKNGGKTEYYLAMKMINNMLGEKEKGVSLKMQTGLRIQKPNKEIETKKEVSKNKHEHYSFMTLSPIDIKLLTENKVAEYKMFMYKTVVTQTESEIISDTFRCLLEK